MSDEMSRQQLRGTQRYRNSGSKAAWRIKPHGGPVSHPLASFTLVLRPHTFPGCARRCRRGGVWSCLWDAGVDQAPVERRCSPVRACVTPRSRRYRATLSRITFHELEKVLTSFLDRSPARPVRSTATRARESAVRPTTPHDDCLHASPPIQEKTTVTPQVYT